MAQSSSEPLGPAVASLPQSMRAWRYVAFGGGADALQLNDRAPVPKPGLREILVKVSASPINAADWKLQSGMLRPMVPWTLPFIPGMDVAGEVVEVGLNASPFKRGDRVFGILPMPKGGGYAEYAALPVSSAAVVPEGMPLVHAASLGVAGVTALQALRDGGGIPVGSAPNFDQANPGALSVLVANASGGVGNYAVQLAKLAGAHVTATCGARNIDFVKNLGADDVLDYKSPEGAALTSPSGRTYNVIVDGTGALTWSTVKRVLSPKGKWVNLTPNLSVFASSLLQKLTFSGKQAVPLMSEARAADLSLLGRLAAGGALRTHIEAEVPFSQAPEAWRKGMQGHTVGKLVLVMDAAASNE